MFTTFFLQFLLISSAALSASAEPSLSLKITGAKRVHGVQNLKVNTTLENTGDVTLHLFKDPRTILSDVPMNTFTITNSNGSNPNFMGVKAKYVRKFVIAHGREDSFTVLQPGQKIEIEHDLSNIYDFSNGGAGSYELEARRKFHYLDVATNKSVAIFANTGPDLVHRATITGDLTPTRRSVKRSKRSRISRRANYVGCSAEQQNQINEGAAAAKKYATEALAYVQGNTETERLKTWYGEHDQERSNRLVQVFRNMNDNDFSSYDYDCSCTEADLFAFVYPEDWGTVHLCGAFWSAPVTGANSKGGTIFHEATHFKENAGTDDNAYGQDDCKTLASTNPAEAINNADSFEYFVENEPALK